MLVGGLSYTKQLLVVLIMQLKIGTAKSLIQLLNAPCSCMKEKKYDGNLSSMKKAQHFLLYQTMVMMSNSALSSYVCGAL